MRGGRRLRSVVAFRFRPRVAPALAIALLIALVGACTTDPGATPAITPGTPSHPRAVIILAKDYTYVPAVLDLVPGESVVLQIVNGGLIVHEVVIGTMRVQDAWEQAEAAAVGGPPGPTPAIRVSPDVAGLRVVVASGQRVDVPWTVPADAADAGVAWLLGCHIPGHWAAGMVIPIRFVDGAGRPLLTVSPSTAP